MTTAERLQRVERENPVVPIARQCAWLGVPRSSVYYQGKPVVSEDDLALMKRLDALHLQHPFLGSRRLRDRLERDGVFVNRKRIQRLMQVMGIKTLYPRRKTSAPGPGHRIYPYLLRGMTITRPNQVWCADVTYIPMARGFCYLVAIMDWATRAVLAWRLATTLEADSCVEALEEALECYGASQIFNTDQGAQFTSEAFTDVLKGHTIDISMDGKGCWRDNVFVERLWRSVKYEEVVCYERESSGSEQSRCFTKDEGGPLGVGLQEQASNHHKLRELRAHVVSVAGKGGVRLRQVRIEKTNASEPLMTCRNVLSEVETGILTSIPRAKVGVKWSPVDGPLMDGLNQPLGGHYGTSGSCSIYRRLQGAGSVIGREPRSGKGCPQARYFGQDAG